MATTASPHCITTSSLFRHKLKHPLPQFGLSHIPRRRRRMASSDAGNAGKEEEVLIQYVVLRRDLLDTWPMGSVVTQGCRGAVAAIWSHKDDSHTLDYCSPTNLDSMHKRLVGGSTQHSRYGWNLYTYLYNQLYRENKLGTEFLGHLISSYLISM